MSKKSMTLNTNNIITVRDNLSKTITSYWKIIERTNLMTIAEAKKYRNYDLKMLYNKITQMADSRIKTKLLLNAINSNQKTFDFNDIENTHYYTIYKLNELNEQKVHLGIVLSKHTINPAAKAKAGNKLNKSEVFTHAKLASMINKLDIQIEDLKAKIVKFNNDTEIEISNMDDSLFEKQIAA